MNVSICVHDTGGRGGFTPPQTRPNAVLQDPDYATLEADDRSDCRMSIG